ncbi:alpha/beta fold hydrolase [Amycolatopsis jejuensis]|uniref:alpha/beta fold hydrolase n=1 Tax=Amycolatopsis jejuensis TaxID=330084 RepID=UPI000525FFF6|nr:alpha/beta fold hydrolase [Amycolatopsis jejuensis]
MTFTKKLAVAGLATAALFPLAAPAQAQPPETRSAKISWQACTEPYFQGLDCGTLKAPADYARPWAGETTLSLVRRKAEDSAGRVGSLLLNNVEGASSIEQLRYGLESKAIPGTGLAKRFDLVAVDPRGVGHSTPVTCADQPQRAPGVTFFPSTGEQYQALVDNNRKLAAACAKSAPLTNLDLGTTARDLDLVRAGLGERQITWYGIGWSSELGKTYAQLFPGRLRSLVADSTPDFTQPPVARLAAEISAAEDSFNRFTQWCRDNAKCALHGQDVGAVFDQLVAKADQTPIPGRNGRPLDGQEIRSRMQGMLNMSPYWPATAAALKKAIAGDGSAFAPQDKTLDPIQAQVRACAEGPQPATDLAGMTQLARMAKQLSPHLGGAVQGWTALAGCQGWPVQPDLSGPKPVRQAPAALVVQSTHQASAAYSSGFGFAASLPGSRVLTRDGDEYSMYIFSACVREHVDRYLTERVLPAPGTVCAP